MDMKEVMDHVRGELRERPDSHFSEVYFRILERGASSTNVHTALYEMLKRDEVRIKDGKWTGPRAGRSRLRQRMALSRSHPRAGHNDAPDFAVW